MATAAVVTALLVMALMLGVLLVATSDPFSILFTFTFIHTSYKLTFKRRIKSHLPFAGIIRSSPYSPRFQDKG